MNRFWIRGFGFFVSVIGIIWGRNSSALIDNSVYMQCGTTVDYFSVNGAIYNVMACDDNRSDYVLAWGRSITRNYPECPDGPDEYDYSLHIVTAGSGIDDSICYCDITGIACPRTSMWMEWISMNGCQSGYPDTGTSDCAYYTSYRGVYLSLTGCQQGYAETSLTLLKYYPITGSYWNQNPPEYCVQCPGLGYDGNSFYEFTPFSGITSSGQISWGAASGSGGGCIAHINGSIKNSKGTFSVPSGCPYQK